MAEHKTRYLLPKCNMRFRLSKYKTIANIYPDKNTVLAWKKVEAINSKITSK